MGQHKHNPTAIAAKNGELPPKKREPQLTKRQAERILKAEILSRCTPLLALPYELQNSIGREYMDYDRLYPARVFAKVRRTVSMRLGGGRSSAGGLY